VIIAFSVFELLIFLIDSFADLYGFSEVKWSSFDGGDAGWNRSCIDRIVVGSVNFDPMLEIARATLSSKIKVTVVR
jgi:hypothetical protein